MHFFTFIREDAQKNKCFFSSRTTKKGGGVKPLESISKKTFLSKKKMDEKNVNH